MKLIILNFRDLFYISHFQGSRRCLTSVHTDQTFCEYIQVKGFNSFKTSYFPYVVALEGPGSFEARKPSQGIALRLRLQYLQIWVNSSSPEFPKISWGNWVCQEVTFFTYLVSFWEACKWGTRMIFPRGFIGSIKSTLVP